MVASMKATGKKTCERTKGKLGLKNKSVNVFTEDTIYFSSVTTVASIAIHFNWL